MPLAGDIPETVSARKIPTMSRISSCDAGFSESSGLERVSQASRGLEVHPFEPFCCTCDELGRDANVRLRLGISRLDTIAIVS